MNRLKCFVWGMTAGTAGGTALTAALYQAGGPEWLLPLAITLGTTAYHFLIRLVIGGAVDLAMNNQADPESRWFRQRSWEPRLYRRLGVKKWKKHMPTYVPRLFSLEERTPGAVAGAMCQAEVVHEIGAAASLLPLVMIRWFGAWPAFLLTSLASMGLELALVAVQRYNRPRVLRMDRGAERRPPAPAQ